MYRDALYSLDRFEKAEPRAERRRPDADQAPSPLQEAPPIASLDEFIKAHNLPERLRHIIRDGSAESVEGPKEPDNSRSAWLFDGICNLQRFGVSREEILSVILDRRFGISASILDKRSSARAYAVRQIERAEDFVSDPDLLELNDAFAVIENHGGKCVVLEEPKDAGATEAHSLQSFADFERRFSNRDKVMGTDSKGRPQKMPLAKWWLSHPKRRQYRRIEFAPGLNPADAYNTWRGFAVEADPGDGHLAFLDFIRECIAPVEMLFEYLIRWMAYCVQHPAQCGHVAIVLRGGKGVGKSFFARHFGRLFGRHFSHVTHARHLTGNFNGHLEDVVVLFADEAFAVQDRQAEAVLKTLITEETFIVERKGYDARTTRNCVHVLMSSNSDWVVAASEDERRYAMFDVTTDRREDTTYFAELEKQLEGGGHANLLHFLQTLPLDGFNVRKAPKSAALDEQRAATLQGFERIFYQMLQNGRLPPATHRDLRFVATEDLEKFARDLLPPHVEVTSTQVSDLLGPGRLRGGRVGRRGLGFLKARRKKGGPRGWTIPPLQEARRRWSEARFPGDWFDGDEHDWEMFDTTVERDPF